MSEPTMEDVARAAGVGVATVDRVINRRAKVRPETAQRVLDAAEKLRFRRSGLIRHRIGEQTGAQRLGFILQRRGSPFYRELGEALIEAVQARSDPRAHAVIEFLDDLTPRRVAATLRELGARVDALALVAADDPQVSRAIDELSGRGIPVFALVSDLTADSLAGHVGIDNRKVGRTAAWAISRLSPAPGKIGLILGSHRYLCQEQCEIGFRSYLREFAADFHVLESLVSLEDVNVAQSATLELLHRHPDLVGVYVAGGGIEGVIEGLKAARTAHLVTVCHDLTEVTQQALVEGTVTMVLSHPREWMAARVAEAMSDAIRARPKPGKQTSWLPFTTHTVANA